MKACAIVSVIREKIAVREVSRQNDGLYFVYAVYMSPQPRQNVLRSAFNGLYKSTCINSLHASEN